MMPQLHRFRLEGLHCAACVARVEGALRQTPGVQSASVNLATREASVTTAVSVEEAVLVQAVEHAGYRAFSIRDDDDQTALKLREAARQQREWLLWLASLLLAAPVMVLSMGHWHLPHLSWCLCLLATPVVLLGGASFFAGAAKGLARGSVDMNTLIALSTGTAWGVSLLATVFPAILGPGTSPHLFYESAAMIVVFVRLGRLLEERARSQTSSAVKKLLGLQVKQASVLRDGREVLVNIEDIQIGETVLLKPGELIPVDGTIQEGRSAIDEATLTGEPVPVEKSVGDPVFAGTLNGSGSLRVRTTHPAAGTLLRQIIELVRTAQGTKAPIARLADQVSAIFAPAVLLLAIMAFLGWWFFDATGDARQHAVLAVVNVLIIACPCALGLATPTAIMVAIGHGAELGVLIKQGATIEQLARIRTVIFDKTGTLTVGRPQLVHIVSGPAITAEEPLQVAVTLEARSEHPLAAAIVDAARQRSLPPHNATQIEAQVGQGIVGQLGAEQICVGQPELLRKQGIPDTVIQSLALPDDPSLTWVWVGRGDNLLGALGLADVLKPNAQQVVSWLQARGLRQVLLTGDRQATAEHWARQLGITEVIAQVLPTEKAEHVRRWQGPQSPVLMIGDGINDAPALAQADVGVALSSGTDVAVSASDVTLLGSDLSGLITALALAKQTMATIHQNLFLAFVYNVCSLPVAAGVFYPWTHRFLDPMAASIAMTLSSLLVVGNSLRLRGFQPPLPRLHVPTPGKNAVAPQQPTPREVFQLSFPKR